MDVKGTGIETENKNKKPKSNHRCGYILSSVTVYKMNHRKRN